MSEIIAPPNFKSEREQEQWLSGKATRIELTQALMASEERTVKGVNEQLGKMGNMMQTLFTLNRVNGMQLESLVRLMEKAVPDFRDNFLKEFEKTKELVLFLDKFSNNGEFAGKPIKEQIQLYRDWNANTEHVQITGKHTNIQKYVMEHTDEFNQEELDALRTDFDIMVPVIPEPVAEAGPVTVEEAKL